MKNIPIIFMLLVAIVFCAFSSGAKEKTLPSNVYEWQSISKEKAKDGTR